MHAAVISGLFVYPVKSCAAVAVSEARCGLTGLEHDREWVVLSADGKTLTQRDLPKMALIRPFVSDSGELTLSADGVGRCAVGGGAEQSRAPVPVNVWGQEIPGIDQGDEAADWLSEFLGVSCRLARANGTRLRSGFHESEIGRVAFADASPLLIVSEASMADLNGRLEKPVSVDRFRPSIVLDGVRAYGEDRMEAASAGDGVRLRRAKTCARCVIVNIEQESGVPDQDGAVLRTLARDRNVNGKAMFGCYFDVVGSGVLRIGDWLTPVS